MVTVQHTSRIAHVFDTQNGLMNHFEAVRNVRLYSITNFLYHITLYINSRILLEKSFEGNGSYAIQNENILRSMLFILSFIYW